VICWAGDGRRHRQRIQGTRMRGHRIRFWAAHRPSCSDDPVEHRRGQRSVAVDVTSSKQRSPPAPLRLSPQPPPRDIGQLGVVVGIRTANRGARPFHPMRARRRTYEPRPASSPPATHTLGGDSPRSSGSARFHRRAGRADKGAATRYGPSPLSSVPGEKAGLRPRPGWTFIPSPPVAW